MGGVLNNLFYFSSQKSKSAKKIGVRRAGPCFKENSKSRTLFEADRFSSAEDFRDFSDKMGGLIFPSSKTEHDIGMQSFSRGSKDRRVSPLKIFVIRFLNRYEVAVLKRGEHAVSPKADLSFSGLV